MYNAESVLRSARQLPGPCAESGDNLIFVSSSGDRLAEDVLRDLRSITDSSLGRLAVDELLSVILQRVCQILRADAAAVLLLDASSAQLVTRAAVGFGEVCPDFRIDLGAGFAAVIARQKRPMVLNNIDAAIIPDPALRARGLTTMLVIPLLSRGQVVGLLYVGALEERSFGDVDIELAQVAADRIASVTEPRTWELEGVAAGVLQARFLPAGIPSIEGLEFSARYVPAQHGGVGGDWYDVFVVPSGHVWVVTGDVRGHDLTAAAVMARLRGTIQAYAFEGGRPAEVLARTDRELEHFEPDEMATVVCAVLEPPFDQIRVCLAGHPPPVRAVPGGASILIDPPVGPPLGVVSDADRMAKDFEFPAGAVLFCYTDGLIERPGEGLDVSLGRLQAAVTAADPERVCQSAMEALVGGRIPHDDIAAVAVRRRLPG
jgi:hypothetical protein